MKTRHFISQIEKASLVAAIEAAQKGNSGDIVLLISEKKVNDPVEAASDAFRRLSLKKTTHPHCVLIFVAPESQKLAVIGGTELYKKLPALWWEDLVREMTSRFAQQHLTEGLISGIERIGVVLNEHFRSQNQQDRSAQSDLIEESRS